MTNIITMHAADGTHNVSHDKESAQTSNQPFAKRPIGNSRYELWIPQMHHF
jgi:hypothetical protein